MSTDANKGRLDEAGGKFWDTMLRAGRMPKAAARQAARDAYGTDARAIGSHVREGYLRADGDDYVVAQRGRDHAADAVAKVRTGRKAPKT
jgi:hypothetical protein